MKNHNQHKSVYCHAHKEPLCRCACGRLATRLEAIISNGEALSAIERAWCFEQIVAHNPELGEPYAAAGDIQLADGVLRCWEEAASPEGATDDAPEPTPTAPAEACVAELAE